jgi:hypothetical protein
MVHLRGPVWELLSRRLIAQLPRPIKLSYRHLSPAVINTAAIPRVRDSIALHIPNPAVQVITTAAGLLDRLPTARRPG